MCENLIFFFFFLDYWISFILIFILITEILFIGEK
jgi:hypothetical protein